MKEEEIESNSIGLEGLTLESCIGEWPRSWHKVDVFCGRRHSRETRRRKRKALYRQSSAAVGYP